MSTPNKITVIIAAYNAADVLPGCLKSLADQTITPETIVVNDGSTDDLVTVKNSFPNIIFIDVPHAGPGPARNTAAQSVHGDILVFVDADMTFDPHFLDRLTAPIRSGQTKGTWTKEELVANWDNPTARCWNLEYTHGRDRSRIPLNHGDESPVFRAILKSEFVKIHGFDPGGYTDDWSLSKKLGYPAIAAAGAVMYHQNPDGLRSVWKQAVWVAKRDYKFGEIGRMIALLRATLPISMMVGLYRSLKFNFPIYLPFKLWFDLAICYGIVDFWLTGKTAK